MYNSSPPRTSTANSSWLLPSRRRLVYPDEEAPARVTTSPLTPRGLRVRTPPLQTLHTTTHTTRSSVAPRRASSVAPGQPAASSWTARHGSQPSSRLSAVSPVRTVRPTVTPTTARSPARAINSPPAPSLAAHRTAPQRRFSSSFSGRRSSSLPPGYATGTPGGRGATQLAPPPAAAAAVVAPSTPRATTPRRSFSKPSGTPLPSSAAAGIPPLSSINHRGRLSAQTPYTAPKAQVVECAYFDSVPKRGFEGLFRAAAAVVTHTSPDLSLHQCPEDPSRQTAKEDKAASHAEVTVAATPPCTPEEGSSQDISLNAGAITEEEPAAELATSTLNISQNAPTSARQAHPRRRPATGGPPTSPLRHPGGLAAHSSRHVRTISGGGGGVDGGSQGHSRAPSVTSSGVGSSRFGATSSARTPCRPRSVGRSSLGGSVTPQRLRSGLSVAASTTRGGAMASDSRTVKHNQAKLNKNLDMTQLHTTGLHASLWVAGQDGSVEVRPLSDPGVILSVIPAKKASRSVVTSLVQVSANAVVVGASDGHLRAFETSSLAEFVEIRAHSAAVTCLTTAGVPLTGGEPLSDKTPLIISGSADWTIGLWHSHTLSPVARLQGNRHGVTALCAAPSGCYLFSGSEDGALRVWDLRNGTAVELTKEQRHMLQNAAMAARIRSRRAPRGRASTGAAAGANGRDASPSPSSSSSEEEDSPAQRVERASDRFQASAQPNHDGSLLAGHGTDISPLRTARHASRRSSHQHHHHDAEAKRKASTGAASTSSGTVLGNGAGSKDLSVAMRRAETFIQEYQRAASDHSTSRLLANGAMATPSAKESTAFSDPVTFNWPAELAHREAVSGLAVVEDRWLVSVSRDTAAKVFGLPNGVLVRSLVMQRRMPLTGVMYDASEARLLIGGADGTVLGFDMRSREMDLVLQVRPPSLSFSSVYAPMDRRSMHRFFLCAGSSLDAPWQSINEKKRAPTTEEDKTAEAEAKENGKPAMRVLSVAAFDKTTLAHGPGRTFTTYRVGEPSLRELNNSMQLSKLHAQVMQNQQMREKVRAMGTLEEMTRRDGRRCTRTLHLWHARRFLCSYFESWQRFAARRRLRNEHAAQVKAMSTVVRETVVARYYATWRRFCALIRLQEHQDSMRVLTDRAKPFLAHSADVDLDQTLARNPLVVAATHRTRATVAAALADASARRTLSAFYYAWGGLVRQRHVEERREVALNRLLLSFSGPRYSSTTYIWQSAVKQALRTARLRRASALLAQSQETLSIPRLRWAYWSKWRESVKCAKQQRGRTEQQNAWRLVEPLSATLVRPQPLRARYYFLWRDFALYVSKQGRLVEEQRTLQREYLSLQNTMDNPSTVEQLRAEEKELETAIARTAFERDAMVTKEKVLRQEVLSLRMGDALKVLLTGFSNDAHARPTGSRVQGGAEPPSPVTAAGGSRRESALRGAPPSLQVHNRSSHPQSATGPWMRGSAGSSVAPDEDDGGAVHSSSTSVLLAQLKSVMSAVKGTALQYARDEKQIVSAYNFALYIPIVDPTSPQQHQQSSHDLSASYGSLGSGGGSRPGAGPQHRRQLSHSGNMGGASSTNWSVTVTSTGSAGASRRVSASAGAAGRPAYSPRIAGGHMGNASHGSEAAASAKRYSSLAEAFDATTQQLHAVLCSAAREAGVDLEGTNGLLILPNATAEDNAVNGGDSPGMIQAHRLPGDNINDHDDDLEMQARKPSQVPQPQPRALTPRAGANVVTGDTRSASPRPRSQPQTQPQGPRDTLQESLRWLRFVSGRTRKEVMGLALQLVVLYDSFAAHSEMSLETGNASISTRGTTVVRALPLSALCTEATALLLVRHAAALLELLQPNLWQYQTRLLEAAESHTKDDAVLVSVLDPNAPPVVGGEGGNSSSAGSSQRNSMGGYGDRSVYPTQTQQQQQRRLTGLSGTSVTGLNHSYSLSGDENGDDSFMEAEASAQESTAQYTSRTEGSPRPYRPAAEPYKPQLRLSTAALARPSHPQSGGTTRRGRSSGPAASSSSHPTRPCDIDAATLPGFELPRTTISSTSPHRTPPASVGQDGPYRGRSESGHAGSLHAAYTGVNTSRESGSVGGVNGDFDDSVMFGQSMRSYSGASTPRSMTPRSLTPRSLTPRSGAAGLSAAVAGTVIQKPFLGFRVNVQRAGGQENRTCITVKEIVPSYISAAGEVEGGPALLAGMAVGDELVRFAGYTVTDLAAFNAIVSRHVKAGTEIPVTLLRNGERIDTRIHVGLKSNMV